METTESGQSLNVFNGKLITRACTYIFIQKLLKLSYINPYD